MPTSRPRRARAAVSPKCPFWRHPRLDQVAHSVYRKSRSAARRRWPATLQPQRRTLRAPQLDHLARADHTHAWRALGAEESVSRRRPGDADAGTARRCSDGVLPACRCCGCANTVAQWRGYTRGVPGHAYIRRTPLDRAVFRGRGTLRGADVQRTGARAHPQGPWDGRNVCVPRVSAA